MNISEEMLKDVKNITKEYKLFEKIIKYSSYKQEVFIIDEA